MNIFETKADEKAETVSSVRTVMVPSECHDGTMGLINRAVMTAADVRHVERPRYGHKV